MTKEELVTRIKERKSVLCVGLDSDIAKIPAHLHTFDDPQFEFNRQIIEATRPYCVAYKLNTAFYESLGAQGWTTMEKTIAYIGKEHFIIADAKRGDIGNTCDMYAKAFFETMNADAITIAPYMGQDSAQSFLNYKNKFSILLALTSNPSAIDFEFIQNQQGEELYKTVLRKSKTWGNEENMMYVVGATRPEYFKEIRKIVPNHFLLVPGVGAQGGDLDEVMQNGLNENYGLLINSSRSIIFASTEEDFALKAGDSAKETQLQMAKYIL